MCDPMDHCDGAEVPRERRVYLEVFGCQMNRLDGELILEVLERQDYRRSERPDGAGVILYHTCSVRQHAVDRFLSHLGRMRARKHRDPDLVVGVVGCVAQHLGDRIRRDHPHVDIICGTREFGRLPELIEQVRRRRAPVVALAMDACDEPRRERNLGPSPFQAYVAILRGCRMHCSYCIVPTARGPESSRPADEIVDEARRLIDGGVREITLLGQTVDAYGLAPGGPRLADLLARLDAIPGLARLRFLTSHPLFVDDAILEAMASLPSACEYLHMPAQSGADDVLRRMRRGYTAAEYLALVDRARAIVPGIAIAGDFIVGFPGETKADARASLDLLRRAQYQNAFFFLYSPREGTEAASWPDDVPDAEKRWRHIWLSGEQSGISRAIYERRIGEEVEVLIEGPSKTNAARRTGRTRTFQIAIVDDPVPAGELVRIRVESATPLALYGRVVAREGGR
ncbi:MAG: tRNA (N6-isopentenyl adenosine(37)-C2)-methylthiotransferase MiaB [Planctomycetes bacterium]|nr:tRNA (N6-isopentenyl adenosine(37)-C2)-methylthiotransferase MiaB [Planctomycetota bacterium]